MPEVQSNPEQEDNKIFSALGVPYKSEQKAREAIDKKGLDQSMYKVQSFEDGYVIVPKPVLEKEKYWRLKFNDKSNPNDPDDVTLSVNGHTLVMQRDKEVILPNSFKECADHARIPQFRQLPNEPRKHVGTVMVFPYSMIGEATEAEYKKQLASGNRKAKEAKQEDNRLI